MSRRIDIELTSSRPDGSWTWRAAGAREPKGVLEGTILPAPSSVGDIVRVEAEYEVDGITILSVVPGREKGGRDDLLELLPSGEFEPVIQQRAERPQHEAGQRRPRSDRPERTDRGDRGSRDTARRPRREGADASRGDRPPSADRPGSTERADGETRRPRRERPRPSFTPPPELPQRPKPKRLRPGRTRRSEVLAALPEEQRSIAELALQGLSAVRQRLREENIAAKAAGRAEMPEASVLKLAEELLPRLRVADWLDRADAAAAQLDELDLRDLRSVVASSDDPMVARDETTRALAAELKAALLAKQEQEQTLWLADIEAALGVGRVVRALRLSSQPPKAGVPFPAELAARLAAGATSSLTPSDLSDRWSAVLEAVAFSPIRVLVVPSAPPEQVTDELRTTVTRLAPLLPQIAVLFGVEVAPGTPSPKPLRPSPRGAKPGAKPAPRPEGKTPARRRPPPPPARDGATADPAPTEQPTPSEPTATEPTASEPTPSEPTPSEPTASEPTASEPTASDVVPTEQPAAEPPSEPAAAAEPPAAVEQPAVETLAAVEQPAVEQPAVDEPAARDPAPATTPE